MKKLMTGNEAVARGAYESGMNFVAAYPGTPSTEILENIATYKDDIIGEWAPNEKVALESVIGASVAGGRAMAVMKHVGLNVAADPLFTFAYTGVNGGCVIITADEPGMHSSQNEQDNRNYAKHAKIPMVEPSDSQEAKDMIQYALELSEKFDTPVLYRMTTRICHSKSFVELSDRQQVNIKPYEKNIAKYCPVPGYAKIMRIKVEERLEKLKEYSNESPLNYIEWNNSKIGVIASGMSYNYAKEVFGDDASYLKLGFTYPLPQKLIHELHSKVDVLYILEENDPFIEEQVRAMGYGCVGKDKFPNIGELTPDCIKQVLYGKQNDIIEYEKSEIVARPPGLCAGCPHRGFFYIIGKRKDMIVYGDIGCYSLGLLEPFNGMDMFTCMGASISGAHGVQKMLELQKSNKRAVAVIGDSTFFHSGITSLLDVTYNKSNTVTIILDNRITGMTGHQENPGSGYTLDGQASTLINIEDMVKACGIKNVKTIDPNNLEQIKSSLDWALSLTEPSVIITRWPCVLKKMTKEDIEEFNPFTRRVKVDEELCIGCKKCTTIACPAISFLDGKSHITDICVGCEVCVQVCPKQAIEKEGK